MELKCRISGASKDIKSRMFNIMFEFTDEHNAEILYNELNDTEILLSAKKYRAKRSLDANAYAWKLIGEIADKLRSSKEEVYLDMLKKYGQSEIVSVLAHIPVEHYFKYYVEVGESSLDGKLFKHYRVYKGTSEFDTREMAIMIDGIVSDAQDLGIPTDTPDMIANRVSLWRSYGKEYSSMG